MGKAESATQSQNLIARKSCWNRFSINAYDLLRQRTDRQSVCVRKTNVRLPLGEFGLAIRVVDELKILSDAY
jgi:hypothetical protein